MNVIDLLQNNLTHSVVETMAHQIGGSTKETSEATHSAVQILLAALNKNAQSNDDGLVNALQKDHDGSILDHLTDFAKGQSNLDSRTTNGAGILKHILGDKTGGAAELMAKSSGLDADKSSSLLTMLAPIVMGALGKSMRQAPQSGGNVLTDILSSAVRSQKGNQEQMSLLERLLDQDGDGSVIDDILNMGMKFFSRK